MGYIREALIEKPLVLETQRRGGIAYKLTVPGRVHVPDRLLLMPGGRAIFVECKAPGQRLRAGQEREMERLQALGFQAVMLDSKDNAWIFDGEPEIQPEVWVPDILVDSGYRNRRLKK